MNYSIINQTLKKQTINIGIKHCLIPINNRRINQISSLSTFCKNRINLENNYQKDTRFYPNNNLSPLILKLQQQNTFHSFSHGLLNNNQNIFNEGRNIIKNNKKYFSTGEEDNNNEKKDIDPNTFKWTSNNNSNYNSDVNNNSTNSNDNNKSSYSLNQNDNSNNRIDDVWNRRSSNNNNEINNYKNNEINNYKKSPQELKKRANRRHKKRMEKEINTKDDLYQLYIALKERAIAFMNNLPSTIDGTTTSYKQKKVVNADSASPFLLWSSFMCASSFSSWLFRQLTNSSLISTAVFGGITIPAVINFSHLYSQGGKIVAKELGAKECPTTSQLYEVVEEMAKKAKINNIPTVYVHPSEEINALTAGIKSNDSVLLLTNGLLNHLSQDEIKAIIAHMLYHQKTNFTGLGTHLTAMISGFYTPYNFACHLRKSIIEYRQKKNNSLLLDIIVGISSLNVYLTKILTGISYIAQSAFVRYRERQPIPRELMTVSWKSAIRKLYNQPETSKTESLIWTNPSFAHLFLCDGKGEGWEKAANIAENYDDVSKELQNKKFWKKKNVRSVVEYFSIFPSLKKRSEWSETEGEKLK